MEHRIAHACGHEQLHHLPGYASQQERKASWLRTTLCRSCFVAERQAAQAAVAAADVASVAGLDLPDLVGSERQVAWAATLRARRIAGLPESSGATFQHCAAITDAKWWIDQRDLVDDELVRAVDRYVSRPDPVAISRAA